MKHIYQVENNEIDNIKEQIERLKVHQYLASENKKMFERLHLKWKAEKINVDHKIKKLEKLLDEAEMNQYFMEHIDQ